MLGEFFDPKAQVLIQDRIRPHWSQAGAIVFVTFRTNDSIPKSVLKRWELEKTLWLDERGLLGGKNWLDAVALLGESQRALFNRQFDRTREEFLDTCQGRCELKNPEIAQIVVDTLLHFDGDRYQMGDFVVMPNHVHLLAAFRDEQSMAAQFDSWLHYSAVQINRRLGRKGRFWQQEPFDHLVRSLEQYEYLRTYIANNPQKANLRPGEYLYRKYG